VGFVVDKVALEQVFSPRVLRFSPVNLIPPVLYYTEKRKKLIMPQDSGAPVASAAGPFTKKKKKMCALRETLKLCLYL
jgi:hypothetical protein